MSYADFGGKIILHSWGRFRVTAAEAIVAGDLITKGGYIADAEDGKAADAVACEDIASLATGWAALAVEIKKPPTIATGGGVTAGTHGGTAGTVLYLDGSADQGQAIEDVGTISQTVGWVLSTDRVILLPMHRLAGTDASYSGTLTVTGATALNGGLTMDTNAFTVADTSGNTLVAGTLDATGAVTAAEAGGNITGKGLDISDGGTITQITTATTGVTLNNTTGQITTVTQNIAAAGEVEFTVTNSVVAATSTVVVGIASGSTGGTTVASVTAIGASSFKICLTNLHASVAETGDLVINFAVFGGSAT